MQVNTRYWCWLKLVTKIILHSFHYNGVYHKKLIYHDNNIHKYDRQYNSGKHSYSELETVFSLSVCSLPMRDWSYLKMSATLQLQFIISSFLHPYKIRDKTFTWWTKSDCFHYMALYCRSMLQIINQQIRLFAWWYASFLLKQHW